MTVLVVLTDVVVIPRMEVVMVSETDVVTDEVFSSDIVVVTSGMVVVMEIVTEVVTDVVTDVVFSSGIVVVSWDDVVVVSEVVIEEVVSITDVVVVDVESSQSGSGWGQNVSQSPSPYHPFSSHSSVGSQPVMRINIIIVMSQKPAFMLFFIPYL